MTIYPRPENDNGWGVHGPASTNRYGQEFWPLIRDILLETHTKWFLMLDAGDASNIGLAKRLVDLGIMPIVRLYRSQPNPGHLSGGQLEAIKRYLAVGCVYFITNNEPDSPREWSKPMPKNWLEVVVDNAIIDWEHITKAGGIFVFPAFSFGGDRQDIPQMIVNKGRQDIFERLVWSVHNYSLGRPLLYPEDDVTRNGTPIPAATYNAASHYKGANWCWEVSRDEVNRQRRELANPQASVLTDPTGFRAFEWINQRIVQAVGHSIPIMGTESGQNVHAGDGTARWPYADPYRASQMTFEQYQYTAQVDYYYCHCSWLLGHALFGLGMSDYEFQYPWLTALGGQEFGLKESKIKGYYEIPLLDMMREDKGMEKANGPAPKQWPLYNHPWRAGFDENIRYTDPPYILVPYLGHSPYWQLTEIKWQEQGTGRCFVRCKKDNEFVEGQEIISKWDNGQATAKTKGAADNYYGDLPVPAVCNISVFTPEPSDILTNVFIGTVHLTFEYVKDQPIPEPEPGPQPVPSPQPEPEPLPNDSDAGKLLEYTHAQLVDITHQVDLLQDKIFKFLETPAPEPPPIIIVEPDPPGPPPVEISPEAKRPGLWVANGHPGETASLMLDSQPGSLTGFYDYLSFNRIYQHKHENPITDIIVRFQHHRNWQQNPEASAKDLANIVASKWPDLKPLDPYIYFFNEANLHYENGDENPGHQPQYQTPEFYAAYADYIYKVADRIKQQVPEIKLVCPPFAYGHFEDGEPENGVPKVGWAGYDFLQKTIKSHFNNTICGHYYWGDAGGRIKARLYDPVESSWHAFRWQRLLEMCKVRYSLDAKLIIDEAGSFQAGHPDFTKDCSYYAMKCLTDPRVIALCFFLWLDPTNQPGNLPNSWCQQMSPPALEAHVGHLKEWPLPDIQAAIRKYESNDNYQAQNPEGSASGAYQYTDDTWNNYDGKKHAKEASPEVQDRRMMQDLRARDKLYHGDIEMIIAAHYYPKWAGDKSKWDTKVPVKGGIPLRLYINRVLNKWPS